MAEQKQSLKQDMGQKTMAKAIAFAEMLEGKHKALTFKDLFYIVS